MASPPLATAWVPLWPLTSQAPPVSYGVAFPGSPVDGQEHILVDSLTAPTYAWRFRYTASIADAQKWVFIGGAPLYLIDATGGTVAGNVWAASTPVFTAPKTGNYLCEAWAAGSSANTGTFVNMGIDGSSPSWGQSWLTGMQVLSLAGSKVVAKVAGDTIALWFYAQGAGGYSMGSRTLTITPIRVAP